MRIWKVAFSLAVVATILGPPLTGSWQLPEERYLKPLSASDRAWMTREVEGDKCKSAVTDTDRFVCDWWADQLRDSGTWSSRPTVTWEYLATNALVIVASFASVFLLVMATSFLAPRLATAMYSLGRRYWAWLRR